MVKLKNFFNEISNNTRVFTAEDIGAMNPDEFTQNESAIDYQLKTLGIPFNRDLSGNDDVVFVNAYTRSDGTEVKAHYRSKAGHHYGSSFAPANNSINTGGIAGNNHGIVLDERMGYHDPQTGKKVYYDGVMHFGDNGIPTGGATDVMNGTPQVPFQVGIEMNDYSNIYRQLLESSLPELKDWSPTVENQNQYFNINYQTFPPHNDEAITVDMVTPTVEAILGIRGAISGIDYGIKAYNGVKPFLGDIWVGRNLLLHKPYSIMSNLEKQQLKENKIDFYKKYLHNNPLETSFGTVNFRNRQSGEIDTKYSRQLPLLRYKISKFNKNDSIPMQDFKQRPHIKYFDNFKTKWFGKNYDYQIRHNNNDNSIDFYNIKEYELFEKNLKDPKYKQYIEE